MEQLSRENRTVRYHDPIKRAVQLVEESSDRERNEQEEIQMILDNWEFFVPKPTPRVGLPSRLDY